MNTPCLQHFVRPTLLLSTALLGATLSLLIAQPLQAATCTPTYSCSANNVTSVCESQNLPTYGSIIQTINPDTYSNGGFWASSYAGLPYNDPLTRGRICTLLLPGSTPTWWAVGHYASPGDNYIFAWDGSTWRLYGASGRNNRIDNITCSSVTTTVSSFSGPSYCSPGTSTIKTPSRSITINPSSIIRGNSATLEYSTGNIGTPAITTYTTPGNYSYVVPRDYTSIVVEVWGGGGGGGGRSGTGGTGGTSSFDGSVIARGGSGGTHGNSNSRLATPPPLGGSGGTATGGDNNTTGNGGSSYIGDTRYANTYGSGTGGAGAVGGTGGAARGVSESANPRISTNGASGTAPGGGGSGSYSYADTNAYCGKTPCVVTSYYPASGGGGGAYARKTYAAGALTPEAAIPVTVGAGGAGGSGSPVGGNGAAGIVKITAIGGYTHISNVGYVSPNSSGTFSVTPTNTTTYTLTATQLDGTVLTSSATLTVNAPASCSLSALPTAIIRGASATLSYSSSNATSFSISPTVGARTPNSSGTVNVTPSSSTTYTGTAIGSGSGNTASCSASVSVSCNASYTCSGDNIIYTTPSCSSSTYRTCTAPSYCITGSNVCQDPISVTKHLSATPPIARKGGATSLSWTVTGASSCSLTRSDTGATISTAASSNGLMVIITIPTTFSLHCTGSTKSIDESVTVRITPTFQER